MKKRNTFYIKTFAFLFLVVGYVLTTTQDKALDNCLEKGYTLNQCNVLTK